VVIDGTKVLLVRRGQEPLKGEWSLPGGALELGETLQQGVAREVLEETGLIVVPGGIVEILDRITQEETSGRIRYHYVLIDFVCRVAGGTLCCASDADEVRWVEAEELRQGISQQGDKWRAVEVRGAEAEELYQQSAYRLAPATMRVIEKALRLGLAGEPQHE
jgi:ADP-ribose pyrophosphatase YjhB (NUDIX family)